MPLALFIMLAYISLLNNYTHAHFYGFYLAMSTVRQASAPEREALAMRAVVVCELGGQVSERVALLNHVLSVTHLSKAEHTTNNHSLARPAMSAACCHVLQEQLTTRVSHQPRHTHRLLFSLGSKP